MLAGINAPQAGSLRRPPKCDFVPAKVVLAPAMRWGGWLRAMRRIRRLAPLDGAAASS